MLEGSRVVSRRPAGEPVLETRCLVVGRAGLAGKPGFRARTGDIRLWRGEIALLSGANGTGKSTTLACLAGLLAPLEGTVLLGGEKLYGFFGARTRVRRQAALVAAEPYLFRGSVLDNVVYGLKSRGIGRAEAVRRGTKALEQAGLAELTEEPAGSLSTGQIRRVAVIRALLCEPSVLFLDEPDGDLDGEGREWLLETIREAAKGAAVLLTTHLSGDLAGLAQHEIPLDPKFV